MGDALEDDGTNPPMCVLEKKGGTHLFGGAEGGGFTRALCGVRPPLRKPLPITPPESVLPLNPFIEAAKLVPTHWRKLSVTLRFVSCDACLRLAKHEIKQAWQSQDYSNTNRRKIERHSPTED